jgi:hypothetical protein
VFSARSINLKEGVFSVGTVLLFHHNQEITILEDVPEEKYAELKKQSGCNTCSYTINDREIKCSEIQFTVWQEQMDWDFGY